MEGFLKIDKNKKESDFIKTGEHNFSTQDGKLTHLCNYVQNTTINPQYKADCGKILKTVAHCSGKSYCKKCYGK